MLLLLDGALNIIYGLAAIGNSSFFAHPTHYLLGTLDSWGWVSLVIGIVELVAAGSLVAGRRFGRYVGIVVGALAAIEALLDMPGQPLWSLAVFATSIWIIYGLATYYDPDQSRTEVSPAPATSRPLTPRPGA